MHEEIHGTYRGRSRVTILLSNENRRSYFSRAFIYPSPAKDEGRQGTAENILYFCGPFRGAGVVDAHATMEKGNNVFRRNKKNDLLLRNLGSILSFFFFFFSFLVL